MLKVKRSADPRADHETGRRNCAAPPLEFVIAVPQGLDSNTESAAAVLLDREDWQLWWGYCHMVERSITMGR